MSNLSDQRPFTADMDLIAAYKAVHFIIQKYQERGLDAYRIRNRLLVLMQRARRARLWNADQYNLAAEIYRDVIEYRLGVRVTFGRARD